MTREDAISRREVLETQTKYAEYIGATKFWQMRDDIKALSPVNTQPKIGHWITKRTIMHDGEFYCDVCDNDAPFNKTFHFCPNCGAKMEEVEE